MASPLFPVTVDDTSPIIVYSPQADTLGSPDLQAGWNPFYTSSGFVSPPPVANGSALGEIGVGDSLHVTSRDGAALTIRWNGTAISLFGALAPPPSSDISTYTIMLDGTPTTNYASSPPQSNGTDFAPSGLLASLVNLTDAEHELVLTVHNPSGLNSTDSCGGVLLFDRAVIISETGVPSSASSLPPLSTSAPAQTANFPDHDISFNGEWSFSSDLLPAVNASFHLSTHVGDRALLEFNGTAVLLSGLTTPSSGAYNVTLDSTPQGTFDACASFTSSEPTVLFFRSGLDFSVPHTIEVINAGNMVEGLQANCQGNLLVLGAVNITSAGNISPSASSRHSLARGTIAGIVVGTVIAVALLAWLSYAVWRWRRRIAQRKQEMIINPQVSRRSRLSFLLPQRPEDALTPFEKEQSVNSEPVGVLHISRGKEFDLIGEDKHDPGNENSRQKKGKASPSSIGQPSQNSDGSFSIELPDLAPAHLSRSRTHLPGPSQEPPQVSIRQSNAPSRIDPTSPRSPKPRGPREMQGRESTGGILLSPLFPEDVRDEEGALISHFLQAPVISPLRVEFAHEQKPDRPDRSERTGADDENRFSVGAQSLPRSLQQALGRNVDPENPPIGAMQVTSFAEQGALPESGYSFLDLSSSPNLSSLSGSGSKRSSQSRRTSTSEHSARDAALDRRPSMILSMTMGPGRTSSRPSVTTTNISLQPVTISPPPPFPTPPLPTDISRYGQYPHADPNLLPSPTDSIPLTVSDIHFRHSVQSTISSTASQSRRTSALRMSGSHRFPHPPLPALGTSQSQSRGAYTISPPATPAAIAQLHQRQGSQDTRPFIVQKILGLQNTGSAPSTPYETSTPRSWPSGPGGPSGSGSNTTPISSPPGTSTFGFGLGRR